VVMTTILSRNSNIIAPAGYIFSTGGITDIHAKAYITAVEQADGQPLEAGVRNAIQDFIVGCKADGIWTAIKASCIMAGARTLSGALVPLAGAAPTNFNFNFVCSDYNRKTGLKGDGMTKYLDSNRNNNADPQNDQHIALRLTEPDEGTRIRMGVSGAVTNRTTISIFSGSHNFRSRNSTSNETGLLGVSRNNSAEHIYHVGGNSTTLARNSLSPPGDQNIGVFAGGDAQFPSAIRASFYSIGEHIDLAKLDARTTALMAAIDGAIA